MRQSKPLRRPFVMSVCALVGTVTPMLSVACGGQAGAGESCPSSQPRNGTSCSLSSSSSSSSDQCTYGTADVCGNPVTSSCVNGEWTTPIVSCNPPAAEAGLNEPCPATAPVAGTTCSASPTLSCPYDINACGDPTVSFACAGGSWSSHPIAGGCNPPAPLPEAGPDAGEAGSDAGSGPG